MAEGRYPIPIDVNNINATSDIFRLESALAFIAFLARNGEEITLEKILEFLKTLGYFFNEVDEEEKKRKKKQEEERKKMQEEIRKNKKIYEQVFAHYIEQREAVVAIIEDLAVTVRTLTVEEIEEQLEEAYTKEQYPR